MILGVALYAVTGSNNPAWIFFPLVVRAFGLVASMVGMLMRPRGGAAARRHRLAALRALNQGYYVMAGLSRHLHDGHGVSAMLRRATSLVRPGRPGRHRDLHRLRLHHPVLHGRLAGARCRRSPSATQTGPATNIISGFAVGFETTAPAGHHHRHRAGPVLLARHAGHTHRRGRTLTRRSDVGLPVNPRSRRRLRHRRRHDGHADDLRLHPGDGHLRPDHRQRRRYRRDVAPGRRAVRNITDGLDAVGNTTKALTKGYAVGSAALAAFLLFSAYLDKVRQVKADRADRGRRFCRSTCPRCEVFIGGFLGAMLVFLFSSLAIRAVGRAAQGIIEEVRRQFRGRPGHHAGTVAPRLRPLRGHHRPGRAARDGRCPACWPWVRRSSSACCWAGRPTGGAPDGRHDGRHPDGDRAEQRRRRLGQCQEVHRGRRPEGRRAARCWARAPTRTRPPSSATRSATPSRTPPARRCTC